MTGFLATTMITRLVIPQAGFFRPLFSLLKKAGNNTIYSIREHEIVKQLSHQGGVSRYEHSKKVRRRRCRLRIVKVYM